MTLEKIRVVMDKEFDEIIKNKYILGSLLFVPLLFAILMPVSMIAPSVFYPQAYQSDNSTFIGNTFSSGVSSQDSLIIFFMDAVIPFFMMLPAILPTIVASYSIIGEKKNRTLEPLLAAPVSVDEILVGKALSAIIPAMLATWASSLLFFAFSEGIVYAGLHRLIMPDLAMWGAGLLLLSPLLAFLGIMIALIISSRVNDPRVAQQISVIFVIPIMAIFIGQMSGFMLIDMRMILGLAVALVIVDALMLRFARSMFDREEILTRWK
ncbi:MAG TPA: ABC transporter permease subunit [Methanocella sp.]|uniref:ABC transporter permease subunit n=1 Tax=Methanocella sp. TaxID=2052833 RepID=UPI002B80B51D|nr:ABC transporter permease subunit [Methanocella sp.]HTY92197.1 ABC transporter permease subunit [Methanocella sp.]